MDKFVIEGPTPLKGEIAISGSKNAALPLMAASILGNGPSTLHLIPKLRDIYTFNNVIRVTGTKVEFHEAENKLVIDPTHLSHTEAPYDLVRKMRASFYMLGALVGRTGQAKVSLPGGCAWGPRPVDLHLKGMEAMGINIDLDEGYVYASIDGDDVEGGEFTLDPSSVGATINLVLAAVKRAKKFVIKNAAKEPDVVLLCNMLVKMGADIEGIGTDTLTVRKADELRGVEMSNDPDRIETGTYMIAAAMHPESDLTLTGCKPEDLGTFPKHFKKLGVDYSVDGTTIRIRSKEKINPVSVKTEIYPGFPTDLQAQWATLMTQADGESKITDTIYFDRFSYVPELNRLGAKLKVEKNRVTVNGKTELSGASVMSTDLRASVSLVMAGMAAEGTTEVLRVYHLDRGYENLEDKLNSVGASIKRVSEE
ncbi:UDP-N-acetylglucosamine 1-carboxyvinyltransferase [Rhodohalobacter barkolensis]|uniref:UDP-N-acetylglucosamine 1-carboxyvinyltransferase n=1 Tax=Rhodohalobacter barkolensis TaxID=2053187 RepID=A0A2N0VLD7_9BACT|nr:UDP-N-acetylglucosamine 1-carboxyvinyltransferase [Rhodohalobacter barkolensis]PKD45023.1 UDP-N-acetylglucosamine 1-carboxyvinyltransferase [Rhodohalobacter barkolensis]